jgi:hypothetical protein
MTTAIQPKTAQAKKTITGMYVITSFPTNIRMAFGRFRVCGDLGTCTMHYLAT